VEYSLTERGQRAIKVIEYLRDYGHGLMDEYGVGKWK
jgi:DNA-binding HxlR family transcriptional regulator